MTNKQKCFINLCSATLLIASWYSVIVYGFDGVISHNDMARSTELSFRFSLDKWGSDFFGGAVYPLIMILEGKKLGFLIIAMFITSFITFTYNKKFSFCLSTSAVVIATYIGNGCLITPLFMIGLFGSPLICIIFLVFMSMLVAADTVRNILRSFIN